ncbi:MAG TPA: hypothetical protein VMU57_12955 [Edaphobacter sp.]|uniref:hypothetical protein n=1 Tax=Edaphobacter sp. TaxID=1934404 RepID=UPI002BAD0D36|nr:hypothetical protein [Edaphobacter sp.]HUZ95810.1 hypothetical protein [Edaphobacter sp.]
MRAPTKATGGGGYTFADKVAAGFLVQLLRRAFPIEPDFGSIAEVHFEARDSGQVLDDLLLVLKHGNETTRCAISVKSNRQLTKAGFNAEFVQDAWDQWDATTGSGFNRETDLLGLIVGVIDIQTLEEWRGLQKQDVATTPERMVQRLAGAQQSSAIQRAIFQSLHRAPNGVSPDALETARFASRIRVLPFLEGEEGEYINRCAEIVLDGTLDESTKLWSRLLQLAAENRGTGGYFDLPKLVRALRPDFELRDYPDFEADWRSIEAVSAENVKGVRHVIGTEIQLARTDKMNVISAEVAGHNIVVMVGESGSGKSAVVSQLLVTGGPFKRALWLSAEQLSKASQTEVAHVFNLRHSIPDLIHNSTLRGCVLVVDGFERFEGDARRRALELIRAVSDENFIGWKLIVTCQPQSWEATQDALIDASITEMRKVDFAKPSAQEIYDAIPHLPEIRTLLFRTQLQPILRNLVVLDWVLRAEIAKRLSDASQGWIGETELINWVWERWIGGGAMSIARDSLLRTLGEREGERLSGAAHVDSIAQGQLPLLGTLAHEGLIRVNLPSVQFPHDLMGDWARFRVLVFAGNEAVSKIKAVAHIPRWGRAIRLYAQSLAEHGDGLAGWKSLTARLTGENPETQLASDIFLDGLLFATNSEPLLEQVWPHLIAEKGMILRRLLMRLQHAASMPDVRLRGLVDPKYAEQSEVWFRIPHPLYWYPALCVFSRHSKDVAEHALLLAAEVCALWLRTMPDEMPGRREAGLLALDLAKETQGLIAEGMHFGDKDQVVYEALLSAAKEFPEEVTQIALELCARRDEPQHAIERAIETEERQAKLREEWRKKHPEEERTRRIPPPTMLSFPRGTMRAPATDGPLQDVSDGFRSAVLETPALNALIAARPEVAKEVLLAVCIDEPKPSDPYNDRFHLLERYGLADWRHGYPAFYWKGPFLKFLQDAPEHGLDAIVRLVNYATNRWLEDGPGQNLTAEECQKYGLDFEFDGKTTWWLGDGNLFGWHRSVSMNGAAVECALMALEKWLYDEIENGRNISRWVQYIYAHAESLAFAGVLVSVGLKYPALFAGDLQPLLGNFHIYECQLSWTLNELHETWRISLAGQGQPTIKLAAEWHRMAHRRSALRDVAPWLMLQHRGTLEYLSARRIEWSKRLEKAGQGRDALELFLARFDPDNYIQTEQPDGQVLVEMRVPAELQAKIRDAQEEGQLKMLSLTLASRARQYLSGEYTLQPQEVPAFAAQVKRLANWQASAEDRHQAQYRINSLAGGIAVLVVQHRGWLSQDPELEEWCMRTLRELKPAENSEYDTPVSALDSTAESFLGEAGVALLLESDEESVLRMAFEGVTGFYYGSTLQTMWRAYLLREQLGEKFAELANIVVFWSALRRAAIRESGYHADRTLLAKYKETLFRRYVAGRLKGSLVPLRTAETLGRRLVERISRRSTSDGERRVREAQRKAMRQQRDDRKLHREIPDIDFEVIRKGFGFLAAMVRAPLPGEEQTLRHYVRELYDMEMRTLPRPEPGEDNYEIEGTAHEFDVWVMARVAEFIVQANSVDIARTFYRPILDLGPAARYWVEDFLRSWVGVGLEMSADLATFSKIWDDMVRYAMTLPAWQPGERNYWCRAESLVVDLMGLREAQASVLGNAKYIGVVRAMVPAFEEWARLWLKYGSVAAWFAHFLPTESGRVLLAQGIKQLAGFVGLFEDRDWHHHGLGVLLTEALAACWKYLRNEVELQPDLRKAFLSILTDLCARQVPEALHLRNKVSEVLSTS